MANGQGRPLKFKSVHSLEEKINEYFDSCFAPAYNDDGTPVINPATGNQMMYRTKPWTLSGLACHLGIDRKTLYNYSKNDKFFPTIKNARAKIEAYVEEQLFTPKIAAGVIFNLKNNFGWQDKPGEDEKNTEDAVAEALNKVFGENAD